MSWIKTIELQVLFCMAYHGQQKIVKSHSDTASENRNPNTLEMPAVSWSAEDRARAA